MLRRYVLRVEDQPAMRDLALQQALERIAVIERKLQQHGPYKLGSRYSMIDIILYFWGEYLNTGQTLTPFPGLRQCMRLVTNRPIMRPFFNE